jgi:hypothetical protein
MTPSTPFFVGSLVLGLLLSACGEPGIPPALTGSSATLVQPAHETASTEAFSHPDSLYGWLDGYDPAQGLANRIPAPKGFVRPPAETNSFAYWLRGLPLKAEGSPVLLYNGNLKVNQTAHHSVVAMDVGSRDLQQCADAVMRLRAEFLLANGRNADIHFNYTSGQPARWDEWKKGARPVINGSQVTWKVTAQPDASRKSFRAYLDNVFNYAGTASLEKELKPVSSLADIRPGDVFIWGGHPGHAVLVLDVAVKESTGEKVFLLGQSYMPAQEFQVLRNPEDAGLSPWYSTSIEGDLETPEWTFAQSGLRCWAE